MIRLILGFFGYVKVPKAAVQLSTLIEDGYKSVVKAMPDSQEAKKLYKAAQTLTKFLRSGRLL